MKKDALTIAKELEQKYSTKQRDGLRKDHPEIATVAELAEKTFGPVTVRISRERCPTCGSTKKRSSEANRRYWALLHEISDKLLTKDEEGNNTVRHSADVWHLYFKQRFLGSNDITLPNRKVITQPNSSADLEVAEFSDYMDKVQAWAAEHNVHLPD